MKHIVIEIQKTVDGGIANLVSVHDTLPEAESKYHAVLSAAAVSGLPGHGAILMRDDCTPMDWKSYNRELASEEEL